MTLTEAVSEYTTSQHFLFLDDALKGQAEELLAHWAADVDDDIDYDTLETSVNAVGGLDLPLDAKRRFPDLLRTFFEYLESDARFPDAERWQGWLDDIGPAFTDRIRDDGSVRGKTVTRALKVGRNDPCPCGSGKKYKRCCG